MKKIILLLIFVFINIFSYADNKTNINNKGKMNENLRVHFIMPEGDDIDSTAKKDKTLTVLSKFSDKMKLKVSDDGTYFEINIKAFIARTNTGGKIAVIQYMFPNRMWINNYIEMTADVNSYKEISDKLAKWINDNNKDRQIMLLIGRDITGTIAQYLCERVPYTQAMTFDMIALPSEHIDYDDNVSVDGDRMNLVSDQYRLRMLEE